MTSSTLSRPVSAINVARTVGKKEGYLRRECTSRHGHSTQQGWAQTLPEPAESLRSKCLFEAIRHALILLLCSETVALHLALDNVEGVASYPQGFAGQTTVDSYFPARNVFTRYLVASGIQIHEILEGQEPHTVGLRLSPDCYHLAAVQPAEDTFVSRQFTNAVNRAVVQALCTVRLGLKPDTDMLNWAREHRVGHAGKCARQIVLPVRKPRIVGISSPVLLLKISSGLMKGAELNTDLQGY